ncbi:MurR/RpiR family transcriptional regulator [Paractinoplanes rhizophilus]|jgi:DNA-binding MurR/RpiR family transcriptional regulator|uniref:MurR/RpiR family transcriptional regulator n=1 Tax=Paractinoplanes rhizophilus TaxID=1416877 RepID=A0ABW2HM48_9ACTN
MARTRKTAPPRSATATAVHIRALLPSLQPSMRQVAERVLADTTATAGLTVTELAVASGVSEATVVRFCKAIGFAGYPQLRLALAAEAGRAEGADRNGREMDTDIQRGDDLARVVEKIAFADARAVEETGAQLDIVALGRVVEALVRAERVDLYGVGASAFVALDFQQKLHRIGRVAFAWPDTHVALTSAALLRPGDVAIGISHTGTTTDTVDALTEARSHGATTVALTNFPRSPIARAAEHVLTTAARETTFRSGATASRLAQLTVVDCLFVGVAQRTYDRTVAALDATRAAVGSRHRPTPRRAR